MRRRLVEGSFILCLVLLSGCGELDLGSASGDPATDYKTFRSRFRRTGTTGPYRIGDYRPGKVKWTLKFTRIHAPTESTDAEAKDDANSSAEKRQSTQSKTDRRTGDTTEDKQEKRPDKQRTFVAHVRGSGVSDRAKNELLFELVPPMRPGFSVVFLSAPDAVAKWVKMKPGETVTIEGETHFRVFKKYYGGSVLPSHMDVHSPQIEIRDDRNEVAWSSSSRNDNPSRVELVIHVANVRPIATGATTAAQ